MHVSQVCPGLTALLTPDLSKVCGTVIKPSCSVWGQGIQKAKYALFNHSVYVPQDLFPTCASDAPGEFNIGDDVYPFHQDNHLFIHCQRPFLGTSLTPLVLLGGLSVNSGKPGFYSVLPSLG